MIFGDQRILTINGGSSSIKFGVFAIGQSLKRLLKGEISKIGPQAAFSVSGPGQHETISQPIAAPNYEAAINVLVDFLRRRPASDGLTAIGHRVVHGGPTYSRPEPITAEMIAALHQLGPFDAEHLPGELHLIEEFRRRYPALPQIACFDTAFHHDLPTVARLLTLPRRYAAQGVRRYGFHGLSYAFLMEELERLEGAKAAHGRVILAHLGSGASLAAVRGGKSIDTTMSFTPAAGVPMSTRSGDLDPGLVSYFARTEQMSPKRFDAMVNYESGLLGISEISADMEELLLREAGDVRAADAVALFCYEIKKRIGAYCAALGGLDTLVFAGGIGENAPTIRARICADLDCLGILLSPESNANNAPLISNGGARVVVRVIHTDEEREIAKLVASTIDPRPVQDTNS